MSLDANSLLIVPVGFNPQASFLSYSNAGLLHTAGSTLTVPAGKGFSGWGTIDDPVDCQGSIIIPTGGTINFKAGFTLSGAGSICFVDNNFQSDGAFWTMSGGTLFSANHYVGYKTAGVFSQSGGTNSVSTGLCLGSYPNSIGTYNLSGTGELSASDEMVGYMSSGTFNQSGGVNSIANLLQVGPMGSSGNVVATYNLSGTGQLTAANESVDALGFGSTPTAVFNQTGGTNTISESLRMGFYTTTNCRYTLSGNGKLSVGGAGILLYGGRFEWLTDGLTTSYLAMQQPATLAMGFDFSVDALVGGGLFQGAAPQLAGSLEVTNGATATHPGSTQLGLINFILGTSLGSGTYNLIGAGTLGCNYEYIGDSGSGTFQQSAGTNNTTYFRVGNNVGATGSYTLSGTGKLNATDECVGYSGVGSFTQSAGMNTLRNMSSLYLGLNSTATGSYNLNGPGQISALNEYVGFSGRGDFTQSDGNNTVNSSFYLGNNSAAVGSYDLSGSGQLSAPAEYVGYSGRGTFTQSGGTNTSNSLSIGRNSGSNGTYTLSDMGQLVAWYEYVGYYGTGTFTQSGGTNTVSGQLYLSCSTGASASGTYNLSGDGQLSCASRVDRLFELRHRRLQSVGRKQFDHHALLS